ncbi:MAG: HAD hydrolase-like protein, partial [Candidatus Caldarchaeum sp.]|nr:HAD hydrolase-like protein [Candidatus Caldarchaeum sp.]
SPEKFIVPSPTVAEMLRNIRRRGVVVGLHTNSGRRLALKVLSCLGVDEECYDFMVSSDDAEPKPDLAGYVVLLSKAGVKAFESLYVGDRCDVEIAPAKKLGMQTALVHSEACVYADFFLKDVIEVERLI